MNQNGYMPLAVQGMEYVSSVPGLLLTLSVLLLFFNAFFLTRIVIRNVLFINRSYLPSLLFLLYCSLMTEKRSVNCVCIRRVRSSINFKSSAFDFSTSSVCAFMNV